MKKYVLIMILSLILLSVLVFCISYFFQFRLTNVAFVIGLISCFISYSGGGYSALGEGYASIETLGNYRPPSRAVKAIYSVNPVFIASCLLFISSFALFPFIEQ